MEIDSKNWTAEAQAVRLLTVSVEHLANTLILPSLQTCLSISYIVNPSVVHMWKSVGPENLQL